MQHKKKRTNKDFINTNNNFYDINLYNLVTGK